jgi:hypothetical protein
VFSPDQFDAVNGEGNVAKVAHESETSDDALFEDHFEELNHDCLVNFEAEDLKRVETLRNPGNQLDEENRDAENRVQTQIFVMLEIFEDFLISLGKYDPNYEKICDYSGYRDQIAQDLESYLQFNAQKIKKTDVPNIFHLEV